MDESEYRQHSELLKQNKNNNHSVITKFHFAAVFVWKHLRAPDRNLPLFPPLSFCTLLTKSDELLKVTVHSGEQRHSVLHEWAWWTACVCVFNAASVHRGHQRPGNEAQMKTLASAVSLPTLPNCLKQMQSAHCHERDKASNNIKTACLSTQSCFTSHSPARHWANRQWTTER